MLACCARLIDIALAKGGKTVFLCCVSHRNSLFLNHSCDSNVVIHSSGMSRDVARRNSAAAFVSQSSPRRRRAPHPHIQLDSHSARSGGRIDPPGGGRCGFRGSSVGYEHADGQSVALSAVSVRKRPSAASSNLTATAATTTKCCWARHLRQRQERKLLQRGRCG